MTGMASLAFFVTLAMQLACIVVAARSGEPGRRRLARAGMLLLLAPVFALLVAPVLAVAAAFAALAVFWADRSGHDARKPRRKAQWPGWLPLGAFGLLSFVALGTLARQIVTFGATRDERPQLGGEGPVLEALMRASWPLWGLLMLLAVLFVLSAREGRAQS